MSKPLDSTRLQELQYAAKRVTTRLQHSSLSDFLADEDLQDIALLQLVVIGEAAAKISEATRQRHPQIDWRRAAGLRNFIVHEYAKVDFALIWSTITQELPGLVSELPAVLMQVLAAEKTNTSSSV
ncbi:HepT-like ribonuclease domain-containing protein [Hymenobacter sp.]|uniref:HepT-like ribonuclease domain-containing protein n=1 Tax=Hymenobacter sp. TaxID=1898978 RepID=UPI00286A3848|nr:HepT-like ribonuclease domain-containing protein [Hymenobacter sp.]